MNRDDEQREERWDGGRDIFGKENINNLKGENEEKGEGGDQGEKETK